MAYERWKRMDDAVLSSWLRGLRSQDSVTVSAARPFIGTAPRAKKSRGTLGERRIVGAER